MGKPMNRSAQWWVAGWSGAAVLLRLPGLFANHFHADEALFASFARTIAVWRDPLLHMQPVDKPPLLFYLQALFYPLFGPVEFAARLPNFIASILLVPVTAVFAWRLYGEAKTAVMTAVIITCLPLTIQFSATAFLDPLLTFWLMTALMALVANKPGASGILLGLAVFTKYQAWLFVPLLLGLGLLRHCDWRFGRRWLAGFLPVLLLLLLLGMVRTGGIDLWSVQMANFGGLRLAWSWELLPRARAWLTLGQQALGSVWLLVALAFLGMVSLSNRRDRSIKAATTWLITLFGTGYLLLHWLLAVPVWDRYLLPLLPLAVVVAAHQLFIVRSNWVLGVLLFLLLAGAWGARNGRFPIGGQRNADDGASLVAVTLANLPYGTVLYDHWYSWQWRYHLFDKPVYASWQPSPDSLAEELAVFGADGHRHFLVLPDSAAARPFIRSVEAAGFDLQPVMLPEQTQMSLYEIIPSP
ncbi:MAG: glycosyltransferase family 39 protein [Ardenticatenaceae bacterium]|nr:glycosyltransferase family 39 protein [Ardenticatenaceae bacterium]MCB9444824.1 glycosyltransferase family 39 protein [Ardenticatenaceae bacterium]